MFLSLTLTALAATPDAGVHCGPAPCETFKTSRAAFERVLKDAPQILGIGEYHEVEGAPKVPSALKRFRDELLPAVKGKAGALVAETWITTGKCGQVEKQAAAEVKKVTQRPDSTEDELTSMLGRAYDLGLANHVLALTCDEYKTLLDEKGELDAEKSLLLVRRKVEEKALECREKGEGGVAGKMLILYGGALHNDLHPASDMAEFSFGPSLFSETKGAYVELDLLVPEYVARDEDLNKEAWFAPALKLAQAGKNVLVTPAPGVQMLLFAAKPAPKPAAKKSK